MVEVRFKHILAVLVFLTGLSSAAQDTDWMRGFARRSDKDNPIPKELVAKLESDYKTAVKDPKLESEDKPLVRHLMIPVAELTQNAPRALKGPMRIIAPPGGGAIDLADDVTALRGDFRLKILLENDHKEAQQVSKVYFISQSKVREMDGTKWGTGCGKYLDVTSFFKKEMKKGGFVLYTADQRYLSVLRGTFVFVTYTPEALQLASLTFFDSRYTSWDCPQAEVL